MLKKEPPEPLPLSWDQLHPARPAAQKTENTQTEAADSLASDPSTWFEVGQSLAETIDELYIVIVHVL